MGLFAARCPVRPEEQAWIEENLKFLAAGFGERAVHGQVIMPTDDFFPGTYAGTTADVRRVVELVRHRIGVEQDSYVVELADTDDDFVTGLTGYRTTSGNAGEYRREGGLGVISVSMRQAAKPMALVATVAHEFCHHRLMGEGRVDPRRPDNEPLTDLATVFFGFGIFAANAALDFATTSRIGSSGERLTGWQASRLGYLTEPMFGYALAYYAHMRGDTDPMWIRHLDTNPRSFAKKGLRYLREHESR